MRLALIATVMAAILPFGAQAQSNQSNVVCGWTKADFDVVSAALAGTWQVNANTGVVRGMGITMPAVGKNIPPALITYASGQLMINLGAQFPLTYASGPNWNLSPPPGSPAPKQKFLSNADISAAAGCDSGLLPRLITKGHTSVGGVKTDFVTRLYVLNIDLMYGVTTSQFMSAAGPFGGTQVIVLSR